MVLSGWVVEQAEEQEREISNSENTIRPPFKSFKLLHLSVEMFSIRAGQGPLLLKIFFPFSLSQEQFSFQNVSKRLYVTGIGNFQKSRLNAGWQCSSVSQRRVER
jgi:hypothetical protein